MKRNILIITAVLILVSLSLLTGCTRVRIGSEDGSTDTREYDFTDFTDIEIGDAFKLEVIPADTYSIIIDARKSDLDRIEVKKTGDRLEISMDRWLFHFNGSPRVKITMPELRGLYLSGATEGIAKGFKSSQDFDMSLSGASSLDMDMETGDFSSELSGASELIGRLLAKDADIEMSGASDLKLEGSAESISLSCSGASEARMAYFTVDNADIDLSGASEAELTVNGKLDINLSGASTLWYRGDPTLSRFDLSGGSELERR
jgi:hypothetical protein